MAHAPTANGGLRGARNAAGLGLVVGSRRQSAGARAPAHAWDRWLLAAIYGRLHGAKLRLRLWDGTSCGAPDPAATVVIYDRGALLRLAWHADLMFGDDYAAGRIDIDGDFVALLEALFRANPEPGAIGAQWYLRRIIADANALGRTRDNIHHHYDIGNAFYELWLDRELVYTCAYFPTDSATLEQAQIAKMEHVCRKLRLRPGERVIEAGCGWGALARYMARHYGVHVRAYNISHEQIAYARERAAAEGLANRVEFIEDDYRHIHGECDAFVSVGMLEHVGRQYFAAFGDVIDRVLPRDRGRGLLHFIGRNTPAPLHPWIERRIFPGAYAPTLAEVATEVFMRARLTMLDVENLRLHYARTLEQWLARFETKLAQVIEMYDEPFSRAWRLYLAGSIASFTTGSLQLFQISFAREQDNDVPWTRAELYR